MPSACDNWSDYYHTQAGSGSIPYFVGLSHQRGGWARGPFGGGGGRRAGRRGGSQTGGNLFTSAFRRYSVPLFNLLKKHGLSFVKDIASSAKRRAAEALVEGVENVKFNRNSKSTHSPFTSSSSFASPQDVILSESRELVPYQGGLGVKRRRSKRRVKQGGSKRKKKPLKRKKSTFRKRRVQRPSSLQSAGGKKGRNTKKKSSQKARVAYRDIFS